jgi:general secretion pathway protein K
MALLITLSVMAVIVSVALEVNKRTRFSVTSTAVVRDRMNLYYMACSGIEAGRAMLIHDKSTSKRDSIQEDWANPEKVQAVLAELPFDNGRVDVDISDEMGKIQINALVQFPEGRRLNVEQEKLWSNFLGNVATEDNLPEDSTPNAVINSVKDWLDSGDDGMITGITGAESAYYEDLDPPYRCADGPFKHVQDLFLVKGISPEIFGRPADDIERTAVEMQTYFTVYGMKALGGEGQFTFEGKININTAEPEVVAALLPPGNVDLAQVICDFREEKDDTEYANVLDEKWYLNCPGCRSSGINEKLLRLDSDYFRITSTATLNEMSMTLTAVVHRETDRDGRIICRILSHRICQYGGIPPEEGGMSMTDMMSMNRTDNE